MNACFFLPVTQRLSHAVRRVAAAPTQFTGRLDPFHLFTTIRLGHVTAAVFQTRARFYDTVMSDFVE